MTLTNQTSPNQLNPAQLFSRSVRGWSQICAGSSVIESKFMSEPHVALGEVAAARRRGAETTECSESGFRIRTIGLRER